MNIFFIILSTVIGFAASNTIKWSTITDTFLTSLEQESHPRTNIEVNLIYKLEVTAKLLDNSTMTEQNRCVHKFLEILESKVDNVRSRKRYELKENNGLITDDFKAPYKKNVKKFSLRDIEEIFPVFEIKISEENDLSFIVIMTDKVYSELNKKHVSETSWFPKVLAEVRTPRENEANLKGRRNIFSIGTKEV